MSTTNKLNPLLNYLRNHSQENSQFVYNSRSYDVNEIKRIIKNLHITDSVLHRSILQIFNPTNVKTVSNKILGIEKTTLIRNWDKASNVIMNRLVNSDVILPMHGIDVLKRNQQL